MKGSLVLAMALGAAASAMSPTAASAATVDMAFGGQGISTAFTLTYGAATDAKYPQAAEVTAIVGTFSDANVGIVDAPILGLIGVTHAKPDDTNLLAPHDFSRFAVATGTSPESGGFLTYDNLFWPGGSPPTATDYPAAGGVFDIYGLMFSIGDDRVVDLWSNGIFGPPGSAPVVYGVGVATAAAMLDYQPGGVSPVPEPASWGLLICGLGAMAGAMRRRSRR